VASAVRAKGFEVGPAAVARKGKGQVESIGDFLRFVLEVAKAIPKLRHNPTEIFLQARNITVSSAGVLLVVMFLSGATIGNAGHSFLTSLGAVSYVGVTNSIAIIREGTPVIFGYILCAKVGCGLAAEIGAMRISDELDALEVMGVRPLAYVVGSRVLGAMIALPFIYMFGLVLAGYGGYLVNVYVWKDVSPGAIWVNYWRFQTPYDLLGTLIKSFLFINATVLVGCYYGYNADGGPIGVGWNTAKSMLSNVVLIHVLSMFVTLVFWGIDYNIPIAN
jgi:phospholipid/cholesterol/gamma-HCH transport system permease protein